MPPADPFLVALDAALEHLADPAWLGAQSPLASTYVLGRAAAGDGAARGRTLRKRLTEAAATLDEDARRLLEAHSAPGLEEAEFGRLLKSTRGSPALLRLFAALVSAGEPVASALRQTQASPTLEVMVRRVWQRLGEPERELLARVSVHRSRAPLDAYSDHPAYAALAGRELIRPDGAGGLSVPTFARDYAQANVPLDVRAGLHLDAARIYEQRADFTAASWHYLAGREPALAVWTWFRHRESETRHGRAAAARSIFVDVAATDLPAAEDRRALALMRAGWLRDAGEADDALRALDSVAWPAGHPAAGFANLLRGGGAGRGRGVGRGGSGSFCAGPCAALAVPGAGWRRGRGDRCPRAGAFCGVGRHAAGQRLKSQPIGRCARARWPHTRAGEEDSSADYADFRGTIQNRNRRESA